MPHSRQGEAEDNDAFRKFRRGKEFADGQRYATAATARGMKNGGSPMRLKLRAQIVSATSKMAPSPYNLCEGVSFTCLPYEDEVARLLVAIRRTSLQSLGPSRERAAIPEPAESNRLRRRCHRRVPSSRLRVQAPSCASAICRAHSLFPYHSDNPRT